MKTAIILFVIMGLVVLCSGYYISHVAKVLPQTGHATFSFGIFDYPLYSGYEASVSEDAIVYTPTLSFFGRILPQTIIRIERPNYLVAPNWLDGSVNPNGVHYRATTNSVKFDDGSGESVDFYGDLNIGAFTIPSSYVIQVITQTFEHLQIPSISR